MRQRVAVARALAIQPEIILLDEPLSALDALTRAKLQDEFAEISAREKKTIILITNDVDEAILLADRIIPLTPGPRRDAGALVQGRPAASPRAGGDELGSGVHSHSRRGDGQPDGARRHPQRGRAERDPCCRMSCRSRRRAICRQAYTNAAHSPIEERYVEFFEVRKTYPTPKGPLTVVDGFNLQDEEGRVRNAHRPFRLRQVDGSVDGGGAQQDIERRHRARWARGERRRAGSRRRLPVAFADAVADGARERRSRRRPRLSQGQPGRAARHRRILPAPRRPRRRHASARRRTLQRHEAARRHRPRLRAFAQAAPARRAVRHARQPHPLGAAGRADGRLGAHQGHRHLRHPRRRRGDPPRRPGGDDVERPERDDRQHHGGGPAASALAQDAALPPATTTPIAKSFSTSSKPTRAAPIRSRPLLEEIKRKRAERLAAGPKLRIEAAE